MAFFPWHVIKDTLVMAAVFAAPSPLPSTFPPHLDEIANPADAAYVPRPEWYFLSLFELLKYFPGPFEPVATMVIPGLSSGSCSRCRSSIAARRAPFSRGRALSLAMAPSSRARRRSPLMGLADSPESYDPNDWGPRAIAGHALVTAPDSKCARCHVDGGPAAELAITRITKDEEWLLAHMADPVAIAPGVRTDADPAPPPVLTRFQSQSVLAYVRRTRAGAVPPRLDEDDLLAATTFANMCVGCHKIAGEGGESGPDLSHVGARRDGDSIQRIIRDPTSVFPDTMMPPYGERLSERQIAVLTQYLARRQ